MRNVHINMNEFTNPSRVLKQVISLKNSSIFDQILILALWKEGLSQREEILGNVTLVRIKLKSRNLPKNLFFQTFKYFEFFARSLILMRGFKPQVVNAHSLGVLPIAIFYKFTTGSFVVYDTHELETEQSGSTGVRKAASKMIEKKLIRFPELIFVVSEGIADWYVEEYGIVRPTVILNVPRKRKLNRNNHFRRMFNIRPDQTILLYQGGIEVGRGIKEILESLNAREDDEFVIVFMGDGEMSSEVKRSAETSNNIFYLPSVSTEEVLDYTSSADVGISLIQNSCLSYFYCMPNKLFEYAMSGLPVLVSDVKDMATLVRQKQMGIVIQEYSSSGLTKAINELKRNNLLRLSKNSYKAACELSWEIQESVMLQAFNRLLKQ